MTETGPAKIIALVMVQRKGAYAPLTTSGHLLVSGISSSNYVSRNWITSRTFSSMFAQLAARRNPPRSTLLSLVRGLSTRNISRHHGILDLGSVLVSYRTVARCWSGSLLYIRIDCCGYGGCPLLDPRCCFELFNNAIDRRLHTVVLLATALLYMHQSVKV